MTTAADTAVLAALPGGFAGRTGGLPWAKWSGPEQTEIYDALTALKDAKSVALKKTVLYAGDAPAAKPGTSLVHADDAFQAMPVGDQVAIIAEAWLQSTSQPFALPLGAFVWKMFVTGAGISAAVPKP